MSDTQPSPTEKSKKLHVRIPKEYSSSSSSSDENTNDSKQKKGWNWRSMMVLPARLQWIPANWTWSKIKAALRCAVVAWLSGVVFVIPRVEVFLGNACFLLLIASVLSPPSDPFISVLERELLILLFVAIAWGWSCLGMKLADLARNFHDPNVTVRMAATGQYVEGGSSVVIAVFLFLGSAFFLYIKARMGPGPYLFASIFACICLGSIFIFPSTMSTEYTTRLQGILAPLQNAISTHKTFLTSTSSQNPSPHAPDFLTVTKSITDLTKKSEAGLVPLAAASRLLSNDLEVDGRAHGMRGYFELVELSRERLAVGTPFGTPSVSRVQTPAVSRRPSLDFERERGRGEVARTEHAVGTFESQRYMDLENVKFGEPGAVRYTERSMVLLGVSAGPLLGVCEESVGVLRAWFGDVGGSRGVGGGIASGGGGGGGAERLGRLGRAWRVLDEFRRDVRHEVLEPYLPLFSDEERPEGVDVPPHHYLFHCYVYQYHLMQFAGVVLEMLDAVLHLEETRDKPRLWTPIRRLFKWNKYDVPENIENDDDEDPDVIQGLHPIEPMDLGMPTQRDPDALPPRNAFEWVMTLFYHAASSFTHGNTLFAVKAGVFTVLLALPFLIRHSAEFAYKNRVVWAIIMGQLTIARFRGDTAFGLTARIVSTFAGGVVGMVMWYTSTGSGHGNPYGLAAVFFVCFPFFFYARLYWAVHPMINIIFFVTASLVVGYSYQDEHVITPSSPGVGFTVAWKRFTLVTVGVFCAFIISFLPPSTTLRKYQRNLLATSSQELGAIYCSIISFANAHDEHEIQDIVTSLIAVRSKLNRSIFMKANVVYEFSLRGRWPAQRYQQVLDLQLQLAYSLSNLMSIMEHLEPKWTRAFLRRTRFMDSDFQGDVLAVYTMISSSLRTGEPLPQVTPSPLVHRFLARMHGLEVIHRESEEDYGLPRTLTLETLRNEQYMMFCVGVSVAFGIVNRLDKLMVATKEIVGEQYHIHGLGVRAGIELGPRARASATMGQFRPPRDV
ncbi:hypothetical protein BDQ17DRAFT_1413587 [Cyathus striatus]|nr:hypothetical protein BDQ17DRAFT_1413587 [Cyathus striatus]